MLETIEDDFQTLVRIRNNLKKSLYNKIKTCTLQAKFNYTTKLFAEIEENLIKHELEIPESQLKFLIKASREAYYEITEIIKKKLTENRNMVLPNTGNQAAATFDIKTATALIQPYDGSPSGVEAFVDSIALLGDLTQAEHVATAIKFVKTRLSGKARAALPPNPETLGQISDAIKTACKSLETPDTLLAKLKATKNKGDQQKFCDEIESLTQKLSALYTDSQIPPEVANKMATKAGVDTLIKGVSNSELKLILKANEFTSIQKAIQKINESQLEQTAQIFNYKTQYNRGRGRGNFNNNSQRGQYRNNRDNAQNSYYPNRNNNSQNQNFRNHDRQYNNRGNFSQNRPRFGNYQNNFQQTGNSNYQNRNRPNVYYLAPENQLVPQQVPVGGQQITQTQNTNQQQPPQQQQQQPQFQLALANMQRQRQ